MNSVKIQWENFEEKNQDNTSEIKYHFLLSLCCGDKTLSESK